MINGGVFPFSTSSAPLRRRYHFCPHASSKQQFEYSRASPSIRWPNLRFEDFAPTITPSSKVQFSEPVEILNKDVDFVGIGVEGDDEKGVEMVDKSGMEAAEKRSGKTRAKKMTKLALKRAKDWRQRVGFLSEKILKLDSREFVADVIDEKEVQMTATDYCFVVKQVGKVSWQRALEVYEWLNLRRWYSPNARMVATVISVLGRARQDFLAEEIFSRATDVDGEVESDNAANSVHVYNAMMGVYARSGQFGKVRELLKVMKDRDCEPDLVSFNTFINARSKSGNFAKESALELLGEVRKAGLRPDTITYNTLISACSRESNLEEAMMVYEDMVSSICQPDLWTYNAMVSVYGRYGKTKEAEQLFKELGRMGFSADAVTYNSLVFAFAKEGNVKEVERVCDEMIGAGFRKDEITYNTIIHMYGKQGRHELALKSYEDMKLVGCKPDSVTYTVLIDSLGKADRVYEASNLMSEMLNMGVRPTLKTFSALICGYAKVGMRLEAEKTFDHMVKSGIQPDGQAYSIVLDVIVKSGDTRKAIVFYNEMIRNGFNPDEGLYQVMIRVFAKDAKDEDVENLVNDMTKLCVMSPKIISSILVKAECFDLGTKMFKKAILLGDEIDHENLSSILGAYNSSGMHEKASALLDFLNDHAPNSHELITEAVITMLCEKGQVESAINEYNNKLSKVGFHSFGESCNIHQTLITCCEETGYLSEACKLYSDMKFYGLNPCQNIYRRIIMIYCKIGFPETAHCLLDEAEKKGFSFDDLSPHVALIEAYGKLKLLQRAESVLGKLRLQNIVERKLWNALIYAYAESGCYEQARAAFNTMLKDGSYPSVDSVNGLLQALITDGRLSEMYVVVEELQDMDFKISKSSILLMLDAFARAGNIFEVKKIYNGMKESGYLPSMHLFRSMISLFSRGKRVRDVESMVIEMEHGGFKPDLAIFNSLLKMYTGIEDFRKAADTYRRIQLAGFQADEETYNSLILMYSRDHRPEEGLSLLIEMKEKNVEPKLDTYKSLLAACGRALLLKEAENIFQTIQLKGGRFDRSIYHTMLKIYRDSGNHSRAESVLFQMKDSGLQPTIATMHILMDSYGTAGKPEEAENVLNNLIESGLNLSTLPYCSVIDGYLKNDDNNMAIKKLLDMKNDGTEPDHRIWTCFIRGARLCYQTNEAMLLLNSLSDSGFDLPMR